MNRINSICFANTMSFLIYNSSKEENKKRRNTISCKLVIYLYLQKEIAFRKVKQWCYYHRESCQNETNEDQR